MVGLNFRHGRTEFLPLAEALWKGSTLNVQRSQTAKAQSASTDRAWKGGGDEIKHPPEQGQSGDPTGTR